MTWLEHKYLNLVSSRLRNFKRKSSNLYNFSCPLCGDSKHKTTRARGYVFEKNGKYFYHCHNCSISLTFENFLKKVDSRAHTSLLLEKMRGAQTDVDDSTWKTTISPEVMFSDARKELLKLSTINQLDPKHPAYCYIKSRLIPSEFYDILRWCPNFMSWSNVLVPKKFSSELRYDVGRILIPYFSKEHKFFTFAGRALPNTSPQKYIKIVLDDSIPHIFGMDRIDCDKTIFVFEGEFDAMFIPNSVAVGGQQISQLTLIAKLGKFIVIFDNEPHSENTKAKMLKAIINGFKVCIWPGYIQEKDLNEMVQAGLTNIESIIKNNSFSGLEARTKFTKWSNHE